MSFDRTDYSFVVKSTKHPSAPWKWVIYCAGKSSPMQQSSVYFPTMAAASRAGKEALKQLLQKLEAPLSGPPWVSLKG
jgi:hypothetical protein